MRNLKSWKKTWFLHLSRLISHSVTLQQSLALNCPLFLNRLHSSVHSLIPACWGFKKTFSHYGCLLKHWMTQSCFWWLFFIIISLFLILCIWCPACKSCEQFTSGDRVHLITNVHDKHVTVNTVRFMSSCPFHLSLRLSAAQSPHLYISRSVNNQ